jgi:hypothetical protein
MSEVPRSEALAFATSARAQGAAVLRGLLERNEDGRWTVGHIGVESWLSRYEGQEVVLAVLAVDQEAPMPFTRTCRTCGNEYSGRSCPHCEAVRRRLRGG